jgi:hypothetical protein
MQKKEYRKPQLTEYGPVTHLTLGGGDSSIDWSVSFNPLNPGNASVSGSPGNGSCVTVNGVSYCKAVS